MSASPPADSHGSAAPVRRRRWWRVAGVGGVILAVLVAGLWTSAGRQVAERVMGMGASMGSFVDSPPVASPVVPPVAPPVVGAAEDGLDRRLAVLDTALERVSELVAGVQETPWTSVDSARLDDLARGLAQLEERVARLESRMTPDKAALVAVAAANLATAARSGPFLPQLDTLRQLTAGEEQMSSLQPLLAGLTDAAQGGVAGMAQLRAGFSAMAGAVVIAARRQSGAGIWGRLVAQLADVAVLRRTDRDQGEGVDAVLVRMRQRLDAGDLNGVLAESRGFSPAGTVAAGAWLAQVRARRDLDEAVQMLMMQAVNALAPPER